MKDKKPKALTTGQAARYCFVTPDTILNWINAGLMPAQQTAGGRYRIKVEELREFMESHGMSTEALDSEVSNRPYCWEFHGSDHRHHKHEYGTCATCIIHKSKTYNCYMLKGFLPMLHCRIEDCKHCDYYRRWIEGRDDDMLEDREKKAK